MSDLISRDAAIAAIEQARKAFALPDDVPGSRLVNAGFAAARGALEKVPSAAGWVSVNNRLPKHGGCVLVYADSVELAVFDSSDNSFYHFWDGTRDDIYGVTYWQPLPAPPSD